MDTSVVDVGENIFEIISTSGNLELGGSNIDEILVEYVANMFNKENGTDIRKDPGAQQRLFEACEKAKIDLSGQPSTEINLPYITAVDNIPKHLVYTITKAKFDQLIESEVDKTIEITKDAMKKSKLKNSDINDVLLVGGSSRIPQVQEKLEKLFGIKPNKSLNPDLCVSMGASIQGHILGGGESDILLLDVLGISLGIETLGGIFTKLIPDDTTIPTSKSEIFSTAQDNQQGVQISISQGERPMFKDNKKIGEFTLDNIPPAPRGIPKIRVEMNVDSNGILKVTAKDEATGKEKSIRIEGSTSLSKEEIARMKAEAMENEETDKKEKERVDKLNMADSHIFTTRKQIKDLDEKLTDDDKTKLNEAIEVLENDYKSQNIDKIDSDIENLNGVWSEISTRLYQQTQSSSENVNEGSVDDNVQDVEYENVSEEKGV